MKKLRIVFMGTPEFAVASLEQIAQAGFEIAGVVTTPDKPAGRGLKVKESAVKQYAIEHGLKVFQPVKLNDPEFLQSLHSLAADVFVVVAFRKLPEEVWQMPKKGTFNLHASLLPDYRGAAPINHAIINGERITGVTTFFINAGIDTGKIIYKEEIAIGSNETAGELHDRLMVAGAALVIKTLNAIEKENVVSVEQPAIRSALKPAPRIFREDCKINWNQPVSKIHNLIRGLSPYPAAYCTFEMAKGASEFKILRCMPSAIVAGNNAGDALILHEKELLIACSDFYLKIIELQPSGKKPMKAAEFLRGLRDYNLKAL